MFPALFDLAGNLVAARQCTTRFGAVWGVLLTDDPESRIVKWFKESVAVSGALARRHDARKGYYVGYVLAHAKTGIGRDRVPIPIRADQGFSRDVTIVDNGQEKDKSIWYGDQKRLGAHG